MNRYEEEIINKLNGLTINDNFIHSITAMIKFYYVSKTRNRKAEKLVFNIIYSLTNGEANVRALLNTNPFKLNDFVIWAYFLEKFFKENLFSQLFFREVEKLKKENFINKFELPQSFFEEIRFFSEFPKKVEQDDRLNYFILPSDVLDSKLISLISEENKLRLLYYCYFKQNISGIIFLSLRYGFNLKMNIALEECKAEEIFGIWILSGQKEKDE